MNLEAGNTYNHTISFSEVGDIGFRIYANDTLNNLASTLEYVIRVQNLMVSIDLNDRVVSPGDSIALDGVGMLVPDGIPVAGVNVSIWVDGDFETNRTTDGAGHYGYTLTAPSVIGTYVLKVNLTDPNGNYGENSTTFSVRELVFDQFDLLDSHNQFDSILNPGEGYLPGVRIREYDGSDYFEVSDGEFSLTIDGVDYSLVYYGSSVWRTSSSIEASSVLGSHSFSGDVSGTSGNGIAGSQVGNTYAYQVKNISVSFDLNDTVVNPEDSIVLDGIVVLNPDGIPVAGVNVSVWVDGDFETNRTTGGAGHYGYMLIVPSMVGNHWVKVNFTNADGIYGENLVLLRVAQVEAKLYEYPSSLHRGDLISIKSFAKANSSNPLSLVSVWLNYSLPSGWNITSQNNYLYSLEPGGQKWNNATVDILGSAQLGEKNFSVLARSMEGIWGEMNGTTKVWGWSSVDLVYPIGGVNRKDKKKNITCKVLDKVSLEGVSNYPVSFWIDSGWVGNSITNSSGFALYEWNLTAYGLGTHEIKCSINDNASLYYNVSVAESSESVSLLGTLNLTLEKSEDPIYKNDSFLPNESTFNLRVLNVKGEPVEGAYCDFKVDGERIGIKFTNSEGRTSVTYNPPDDSEAGNKTIEVKVTKDKYADAYLYDWIGVQGFLFASIDNPSESILNKGMSYDLNATVWDESGVYYDVGEWYLNGSLIASTKDSRWLVPIDQTLGEYTLEFVASKPFYSSAVKNISIEIWGWSRIDISQEKVRYKPGSVAEIKCLVTDFNTSEAIQAYPVSFYINGSFQTTNITNSEGYAFFHWDTSGHYGSYEIGCSIDTNESLLYNASRIHEASGLIYVENKLYVNAGFSEREIYRSAFTPYETTITFNVTETSTTGVPQPSANAKAWLYVDGSAYNCTTNTNGICSVIYDPPDTITPSNHTLKMNATKSGINSSDTMEDWLVIKGKLYGWIEKPGDGSVWHRGDSVILKAVVKDYGDNPVPDAKVEWNTSKGKVAEGIETSWQIPVDYPLGSESLISSFSKQWYDQFGYEEGIGIWGLSEPRLTSPVPGNYSYGSDMPLSCKVIDSNTSSVIDSYPVKLWVNGTSPADLLNESVGEVGYIWTIPSVGMYKIWCNISDNSDLLYNASKNEDYSLIRAIDLTPPRIENDTIRPDSPIIGQNVNLSFDVYDKYLDSVWVVIGYPNGSISNHAASSAGGNKYYFVIQKVEGGNYNYTCKANDTSQNIGEKFNTFSVLTEGGKLIPNQTSVDVYGITQTQSQSFWLNITLENIASEEMKFANISLSLYHPDYFLVTPESQDCGNISIGGNCTKSFEITVKAGTSPMPSWVIGRGKWRRPDGSEVTVETTVEVNIKPNPVLDVSPSIISNEVRHDESKIVGQVNVSSVGNYKLTNITFASQGGNLLSSWITFTPSLLIDVGVASSRLSNLSVSVPRGQDPGVYETSIIVSSGNANNKTIDLIINVPEDKSWDRDRELISRNVIVGAPGKAGEINVTNLGNIEFGLSVNLEGNASSYLMVELGISIPKQSSKLLEIGYSSIPSAGDYQANLTLAGGSPLKELTTLINLNAVELRIEILKPNESYPLSVNANSLAEIHAKAMLGGVDLGENITWNAYINNTPCEIQSVDYVGYWNLTCLTPNIPDARAYNLTLEGKETNYQVAVNKTEINSIFYPDVTNPVFNQVETSDTEVNGSTIIKANVTDDSIEGVTNVLAEITYPDGSKANFSMENVFAELWQLVFNDTVQEGDYSVLIHAYDSAGNSEGREISFRVSMPVMIKGMLLTLADEPIKGNFTLYRPSSKQIAYRFNTSLNGSYGVKIYSGLYDLEIDAFGNKIKLVGANLSKSLENPVRLDYVPVSAVPVNLTKSRIKAFALNISLDYDNLTLTLGYADKIEKIDKERGLRIYRCEKWNWGERLCEGRWTKLGGKVNTIHHYISLNLSSTSAYVLAEDIDTCSNEVCEPPGENCENCPEDCGECPECGNEVCEPPGENCKNCPEDCGECSRCPNGECETGENCENCPEDCGPCPTPPPSGGIISSPVSLNITSSLDEALESMLNFTGGELEIETKSINLNMYQGEKTETEVSFKNNLGKDVSITAEVKGEVKDFIMFKNPSVRLENKEKGTFYLSVYIPSETLPTMYHGSIVIRANGEGVNIPVNIRVLEVKKPLIDLRVEALTYETPPGSPLKVKVMLYNVGEIEKVGVNLDLQLIDPENLSVIKGVNETLTLETSLGLIRALEVPKGIEEKNYIVKGIGTYMLKNRTISVTSLDYIMVATPLLLREIFGIALWILLSGLVLVASCGGVTYVIYRRHKLLEERKKRYKEMVELKELPKPGPRSGFIGNLAETKTKAFVNLDDLKMHTLIAGATGSGKTISGQILAEEALLKDIAVIVFDPSAQWTGFLRKCEESSMLKKYKEFGMKRKDTKGFKGRIKIVEDPMERIDVKDLMKTGITIFCLNKIKPKDIDLFVANTIREIFEARLEESEALRTLVVYDEVHRLLPRFGGKGQGLIQVERGVREFRKWGVGLILISQVLSDFVGEIKANIGTEIQMRTRYEEDLKRIRMKYGKDIAVSVVKESVGTGVVVNANYNRGRPYFVSFRPILHRVKRLSDSELEKYHKYEERVEGMKYQLKQLKEEGVDTFDIETELKLAESKLMVGAFDMVDIYLESLEPRVKKEWEKLGKRPKPRKRALVKERELKLAIRKAKVERRKHVEREREKLTTERLEHRVEEVKKLITEARKRGKDVYLEELELNRIPSQVDILKVTQESKGMKAVDRKLDELERNIKKKLGRRG
jgi:uncharacterized membrane protein